MATKITIATAIVLRLAGGILNSEDRSESRQQNSFAQLFTLRDVDVTEQQQAQLQVLRSRYTPKLIELQRKRNNLYTPQQRQARREAMQAARSAGKRDRQLRETVDEAVQLTDEQRKTQAALQQEQARLVREINSQVRGLLNAEQRARPRQPAGRDPRESSAAATHRDVKYGKHDRNVMDVWLAKSEEPTPVLVVIHGGGFRGGNKSVDRNLLTQCLDSGISVVSITYRLSDQAIAPAQFLDSARALQFLRHQAKSWNLDPQRFAATGGSAGAGLSLWLGFHDDLADPENEDPVLRQSTRLTCVSVYNGQTSYDPRFIRQLFPDSDTYKHPALSQLYDVDLNQLDNLPQEKYKLFEQVSSINHLSKDDVPAQLFYASKMETPIINQSIGIHHPKFGLALKEKMDKLGIACEVHTGVSRGSDQWTKLTVEFVKKGFGIE